MGSPLHFRCAGCGGINRIDSDRLSDGPTCGRCRRPIDLEAHPADVSDDELERTVAAAPVPVLVDFWAPWCGPCRMVAPVVADVARAHAGQLIVLKVNTDAHQRAAGALGVRGIPHFALYRGGQLVEQRSGALPRPQLEAFLGAVV